MLDDDDDAELILTTLANLKLRVTSLRVGARLGSVFQLGVWIFPTLEELWVDVERATPGNLTRMVERRYKLEGEDCPRPLSVLGVSGAKRPDHEADRAAVEAIVGPEVLVWTWIEGEEYGTF